MDQKKSVGHIYHNYKSNISAIKLYFEKFGSLAQDEDDTALKKRKEFIYDALDEAGIDLDDIDEEDEEEAKIPTENVQTFVNKLSEQPHISAKNYSILSRSSFLMLNNYFEYLIADLITYYYNNFKESLNNKEFNITLKELNEHETINDVTHSLILKEVESMLVDLPFHKVLEHFVEDLDVSLEEDIVEWGKIEEYRERRHLIVHNSSLVNKKYLARTSNPDNYEIGDKVSINEEYFNDASKEFFLAGLLLSLNCWGKWDKQKTDEAIALIVQETFDQLNEEQYDLTSRLTKYAKQIEPRNEDQEDSLLRIRLNRCIALKKIGEKEKLQKELNKLNVGTSSPIFKLAYAILNDDHDSIIDFVKKANSLDEIDLQKYDKWPIYDFLRDEDQIDTQIREVLSN